MKTSKAGQRGFAGLIELAIYAGLAAVVAGFLYGAWHGFVGWVSEPRVQAQLKADQKKVDGAAARAAAAEADRDTARGNYAGLKASCDQQSGEVNRWKGIADDNLKAARIAQEANRRNQAAAAPKIAELQAQAAAKPQLMTCQAELGKAKATLIEALRARRAPPPTAVPK